jgi:NADH pyrophosphatase NudC (nudix superfamily)
MKFVGGDIAKHDFEMENVEWIEQDAVLEQLSFEADKKVFKNALPRILELVKG